MGLPAHLLNQDITHYPKSGRDAYGRETFGAATAYKARAQETTKSRLQPNGQIAIIGLILYLDGNPDIDIDDKITYGSRDFKIFSKNVAVDGQGNGNNTKFECTKWQL